MAEWRDFLRYVQPSVPKCPVASIVTAVKSAAIEFCSRTLMWRVRSTASDIMSGQAQYGMNPPEGCSIAGVIGLEIIKDLNLYPLTPTTEDMLNEGDPSWRLRESPIPTHFFSIDVDDVQLVPEPSEDILDSLYATIAVKPSRDATTCPDFLYEDWAEELAHGALARLMMDPAAAWTNPQAGASHMAAFDSAVLKAKNQALTGKARQGLSVKPRSFL